MSAIFDWAKSDNLQPEPITLEIWRQLPEDFCREVEVVNGEAIRAESPTRPHQKAARRLANMLESAAEAHVRQYQDGCLDVETDFDVVLWELPRTTIRRPDVALFECAPPEVRPLPTSLVKLIIEVVSPGTEKVDVAEKKAEYALAGIPWYWIVWVVDNSVKSIEVHVLDHAFGQYRPHGVLDARSSETVAELPIRVTIDWDRLTELSL
ncbi:Uma2 family endonuclease [Nocardia callitridis]|uniref:Putative restriction endonuclease domain-containing protein n=1 Tax=Nocardia callitridis TaxID=648753 RepID=A0ABP9JR43_9NOCA